MGDLKNIMKSNLRIGIVSHLIRDYNLGCSALAISNLAIMDSIFKAYNVEIEYVVILPKPKENIDLEQFTSLKGITNNSFSYATYPRLKSILKKPWLISTSNAVDDCDYVVDLCGGDGYTDIYGLIRLVAESVPVYMASKKNIPVIFAPQTIGPFNTIIGKMVARHTLNKLLHVFVRDSKSLDCFRKLHIKSLSSQVIDVAFALPYQKQYRKSDKTIIGINVSGLLYNGGYNRDNYFNLSFSYKQFINSLIQKLIEDKAYEIHLIPHVISDEIEIDDDYRVCKKLAEQYTEIILSPKFTSPIDAKSYISGMDIFTGARMHSTIGALSSGVPVIPVAYSRKFNGLYETLQYSYIIDAKANITCEKAIEQFFDYLKNKEMLAKAVDVSAQIYKIELEKYKEELIKLFDLKS